MRKERWRHCPLHQEIQCEELSLKSSHKQAESLRITETEATKGTLWQVSTTGHLIKGSPLKKLTLATGDIMLILLGDFNHSDICWKSSMESCR